MPRLLLICLLHWLTVTAAVAQTKKIDSLRTVLVKHPQADTSTVVHYDTLPEKGIRLNKGWKYHPGDNPAWASRTLDDRNWQAIDPALDARQLPQIPTQGIGWLRLHLYVGHALRQQPLMLDFFQACASEVYLNGRLLHRYGRVSAKPEQVEVDGASEQIGVFFDGQADQVLAIRFASWPKLSLFNRLFTRWLPNAQLWSLARLIQYKNDQTDEARRNAIGFGICLLLTLLHIAFFRYNPAQRANLYFTFFTVSLGYFFGFSALSIDAVDVGVYFIVFLLLLVQGVFLWSLRALYSLFDRRPIPFTMLCGSFYRLIRFCIYGCNYQSGPNIK